MRITFREVKLRGKKSGKCKCGKRATRSEVFFQTVNPFNKNAAGFPKTDGEIYDELREQRRLWLLEPTFHASCEAAAPQAEGGRE